MIKYYGHTMSDTEEMVKKSSVFKDLTQADIEQLISLFDKQEIHPGDILAAAGGMAQSFFLLGKGTVLLAMDEGKATVLNTPGDFIGMELVSVKGICKTTIHVVEKGTVFVIPRQAFLDVIQDDSPAARRIMTAWQAYLEQTAPFAKNIEDASLH